MNANPLQSRWMAWPRCFWAVAALLAVASVCGCHQVPAIDNPQPLAAANYSRTFDAAVDTLKDKGFSIARRDHRFGRITTQPLDAPILIEAWHSSNTTAGQMVEATVNDERRIAAVYIEPLTEAKDQYAVRVEVSVERRQLPTRRLSGSTSPRRLFNTLRGVPHELRQRGIPASYWQPIGRDAFLEHRLLTEIVTRTEAGQSAEAEGQGAESQGAEG